MARAVQLGEAVPPYDNLLNIPEVPMVTGRYETCHPDRIMRFPYRPREVSIISTDDIDSQWRHELDHDTESVFWVLLCWLIGAQPENEVKEPISMDFWSELTGSAAARIVLVSRNLDGATHSVYRPLWPLLNKLSRILNADRQWVESSDPRNDPGYFNEAFQRLILQFILEHRGEKFMQHRVESQPRRPELISGLLESLSSDPRRKRSLSDPTTSRGIWDGTKRFRDSISREVEEMIEVGRRLRRRVLVVFVLTVCF
jgi:hypothetical protein